MPPVTLALIGAGNRGSAHARWALAHPDRARVVAVAEPHAVRRDRLATAWPLDAVIDRRSKDDLTAALRQGPYGRCVYACDNDVVDHRSSRSSSTAGRPVRSP